MGLHEIGKKFGTDKTYIGDNFGVSYMHVYEQVFLRKFSRKQSLNILEIGVREGPSILTWLEYFPRATVVGIDLKDCPDCLKGVDRFAYVKGNQCDTTTLDEATKQFGAFDIIVDDGSHLVKDIRFTYNYLFNNSLKAHGVYVIEDIYNSYRFWNAELPRVHVNGNGESLTEFCGEMMYDIHEACNSKTGKRIFSLEIFPGFMIVTKEPLIDEPHPRPFPWYSKVLQKLGVC